MGPEVKQLGTIEKDNGSEICLGFFNDPTMKEVSAIIFSCTATWGKLSSMTENLDVNKNILTTWSSYPDGKPVLGESSNPDHKEKIYDGLQIYHNPYASIPINPEIFRKERVVQHYLNKSTNKWVYESRCNSLIYRQVLSMSLSK